MGCYIWYSEEGTGWGRSLPRLLLAVPNVTAHPLTASVPIAVLLFNSTLPRSFNVGINGLNRDLSQFLLDLDLEVLSEQVFSSPLNSTIENVYKELVAYLCIHCVLTESAASADVTIAKLFGKYLLAEHEYTKTDSSSSSIKCTSEKNIQSRWSGFSSQ